MVGGIERLTASGAEGVHAPRLARKVLGILIPESVEDGIGLELIFKLGNLAIATLPSLAEVSV